MVAIVPIVTTGAGSAIAALLLGGLAVTLIVGRRAHLDGTTLRAPSLWALGGVLAVAGSEVVAGLFAADPQLDWVPLLRYAAAVATLCPTMAILGARRPLDRGWQWVVVTLPIILQVPSIQWVLFHAGQPLHVDPVWSWFLLLIIALGLANYLPTRFWPSALLWSLGQWMLLSGHLPTNAFAPVGSGTGGATDSLVALALFVLALGLVAAGFPARSPASPPHDRVWLDFRDMYGAVWALRLARRINVSAEVGRWSLRLDWGGFSARDSWERLSPKTSNDLDAALRTWLVRFVSPRWIAARLDTDPDHGQTAAPARIAAAPPPP